MYTAHKLDVKFSVEDKTGEIARVTKLFGVILLINNT